MALRQVLLRYGIEVEGKSKLDDVDKRLDQLGKQATAAAIGLRTLGVSSRRGRSRAASSGAWSNRPTP